MFITQRPNMRKLKITRVGAFGRSHSEQGSQGQASRKKGDSLFLTEVPRGYGLTPNSPEFERQMTLAEEIMHEDSGAFAALSK